MNIFQILYILIVLIVGFLLGIIVKYYTKGVKLLEAIIIGILTPFLLIDIGIKMILKYWQNNNSNLFYKIKRTFQVFFASIKILPMLISILGEAISCSNYSFSQRRRFQNDLHLVKRSLPRFNSKLRKKMA